MNETRFNINQIVPVIDSGGQAFHVPLRSLLLLRGPDLLALLRSLGFQSEFKDPIFEDILSRMLARIPDSLDKRQGSIIYDALAPAAVEFVEAYVEREANRALSYASTSVGQWLDMRVAEHGVFRMSATKALRYGYFWADEDKKEHFDGIPLLGRYSVPNEKTNYIVARKLSFGVYELTCEDAGASGNEPETGISLLPVDYISGLAIAELGEIIAPGEDAETDGQLYDRFVRTITRPPFGGNRADYEEYFRAIDGVGWVRLYRADPEKGHVTAYVLGADTMPPSPELVEEAQTKIDPFVSRGEGIGMAPMAHIVHVHPAAGTPIKVRARLALLRDWSIDQVRKGVEEAVSEFLRSLRTHWADYVSVDSPEYVDCVVRVAPLESAILTVPGVADVYDTEICGKCENFALARDCVPLPGTIELYK